MCRPGFGNPPTYNVNLCRNRPYFMSKNKQNMRIIRLSRHYCLRLYYKSLQRFYHFSGRIIKLNFRLFFNLPSTFMGFWLKSYPCLENFRAKSPPIWSAHTRTQITLSTPPPRGVNSSPMLCQLRGWLQLGTAVNSILVIGLRLVYLFRI